MSEAFVRRHSNWPLLLAVMIVLASRFAQAGAFSRFSGPTGPVRLQLIRDGLAGKLQNAEDKTQFYVLLCQPKRAWAEAEKIKDLALRKRFEGTILALSAIPRFEDDPKSFPKRVLNSDKVAARFDLDQAEVWADEPADTYVPHDCDFPLAALENRQSLLNEAKKDFAIAEEQPIQANFALMALKSDIGLKPEHLNAALLSDLAKQNSDSPYLPRLKFFLAAQSNEESHPTFEIKGTHAIVSPLEFEDAEFKPHPLELPWLLR